MRREILALLLISTAGCAHQSLKIDGLTIEGGSRFTKSPAEAYEPAALETYRGDRGDYIKVMKFANMSRPEAAKKMSDRRHEIESMFQRSVDPYFGTVHDTKSCMRGDLSESPVETGSSFFKVIELPATDKFVFVACADKNAAFKAKLTFLYCEKAKDFFEIKYFSKSGGGFSANCAN